MLDFALTGTEKLTQAMNRMLDGAERGQYRGMLKFVAKMDREVKQRVMSTPRQADPVKGYGQSKTASHFRSVKGHPFAKDSGRYLQSMRFWVETVRSSTGRPLDVNGFNFAAVPYAAALENKDGTDRPVWLDTYNDLKGQGVDMIAAEVRKAAGL